MCNDCIIVYFEGNFKKRLAEQKKLEREMIKRFGENTKDDFRYKILVGDNYIYAEHIPEFILREKEEYLN